ncbi:MAG: thioredoxin [Candidatus Omnitrophica bacterium]|nr:thioredoxin [Candidatus Omnitrophota bacterium]
MGKTVIELTDNNFREEVLNSRIPVLVDFWAVWCGPCKAMAPIIESLAGELETKVKIGKLNVDENPDVTNMFNILNIPTLILFKDGKEMTRMVGINSRIDILKRVEGLI